MLAEFFAVLGLFLIRIGIPVLILLTVGMLVERAYSKRAEQQETASESA